MYTTTQANSLPFYQVLHEGTSDDGRHKICAADEEEIAVCVRERIQHYLFCVQGRSMRWDA